MIHKEIKILTDYTVQIWREGNQYVAHALPLDVMSSGATVEEARRALDEAVHLFLTTAAEIGTLEVVLEGKDRKNLKPSSLLTTHFQKL